jgi:hypothetical protein
MLEVGSVMKRNILAIVLVICVQFGVFGQNNSPIDLVLLLNISSGMSSSYENVNNYITGPFLSEYLRIGDTFHLITFCADSKLDSARRISGIEDVETIIGRMFLQYPVENGSNMAAAISFTEQYLTSLPLRPKKIVIVSTGGTEINNLVNTARQRLGRANATLDFVQVTPGQPLTSLPVSGRAATPSPVSETTSPATPAASPSTAGTASPVTPAASPSTAGTASPATPAASSGTAQAGSSPAGQRAVDASQSGRRTAGTGSFSFSMPVIAGIIVLLLVILGLIIFFSSRRLGSSPNRVMAAVSTRDDREDARFVDHSKDLAKYAAVQSRQRTTPYSDRPLKPESASPTINPTGPLLLNMFVEDQNTAIGKRNIHSLKSGYGLTVGGGKSDFLIFLVPVPSNIGELRRSGSQLTFTPRKPKFFPDLGSNELHDCLN